MPQRPLYRDNEKVAAAARKCLAELADLHDVLVSPSVAMALGFAEALLDELVDAAESNADDCTIGPVASELLKR